MRSRALVMIAILLNASSISVGKGLAYSALARRTRSIAARVLVPENKALAVLSGVRV